MLKSPQPHHHETLRVYLGILLGLILGAFLSSGRLVEMAARKEFGSERERWLATAEVVDEAAQELYLDRPATVIASIRGARVGETDKVIVGELAAVSEPEEAGSSGEFQTASPTTTIPANTDPANTDPGDTEQVQLTTSTAPAPTEVLPTTVPETTTTTTPPLKTATAADPLRIWVGGDSLGQYLGGHIGYKLAPPEVSTIFYDYHISTGLARPDYFNWPARLSEVAQQDPRPELFVYMVGGNDDQAMVVDGVRLEVATPEWWNEYRVRIATFMDVVAFADARLIWVGLPPMKSGVRAEMTPIVNQIAAEEADKRPWVIFVDTFNILSGPDGGYSQYVVGTDGNEELVRQPDGVHVTSEGSLWIAQEVWARVNQEWPDLPAGPG